MKYRAPLLPLALTHSWSPTKFMNFSQIPGLAEAALRLHRESLTGVSCSSFTLSGVCGIQRQSRAQEPI